MMCWTSKCSKLMNGSALHCLPLDTSDRSLDLIGGKGRSLAAMAAAGLPVPAGFYLTTTAYQRFVEDNDLQATILDLACKVTAQDAASFELASASIQTLFEEATLSAEISSVIREAYAALSDSLPGDGESAVAVRSSATAEDLPDLSFAGQQETYLNVRGEAALLVAVRHCWASLWTARAISYRHRMGIDQRTLSMAVVVQVMVPADVSGILFTANPTTGERSELVFNASFGLGEAIVGGQVTPDAYVLDRSSLTIKETLIGAKEQMIVSSGEQGTILQEVTAIQRGQSSLSAPLLSELGSLGLRVEQHFGDSPQDIEWAIADGTCWLLQSRPITNLPAAPLDVRWEPPYPGAKLMRRQVVENMPDPLSPLFAELYLQEGLEQSMDAFLAYFGMPFDIADFVTRPFFTTVNGYAYCRADYKIPWRRIPRIMVWYVKTMPSFLRSVIPHWQDEALPAYLAIIEQWREVRLAEASDEQLLSGVRALTTADALYWFDVSMVMGFAKMTDGLLHFFLRIFASRHSLTSGMFLSGFPSKTLQAQADLETIATQILADETLRELVLATPAGHLLDSLEHHSEGHTLLGDIRRYLDQYGHQIYTLDFAEQTQAEDPLPVLLGLHAMVQNAGSDTPARQAELVRQRKSRLQQTERIFGPIRRWLFRKLLGFAQSYGPNREEALFYIGAAWPVLRSLALELGRRLVEVGTFNAPDDVFYLLSNELEEASRARNENRSLPDFLQLTDDRRQLRQSRKRFHPPAMVPPKAHFKIGPFDLSFFETQMRNEDESNTLNGFAVSPGQVTAPASVILSPADFEKMKPGNILVCPTTTPAWTPLFAQAQGLVTDIGGILAHGSIVAREYGIPAVMGTGNITQRVVSGQRITVDGDRGTVKIVAD